jgi:hypothetical protein
MDVSLARGKYCVDAVNLLLTTFFPVVSDPVPRQRCKTAHVLGFVTQRLGRLRMTQFREIQQVQTSELHVTLFDIWRRVV